MWKEISGFSGYMINEFGEVRNSQGLILSQHINRYGYKYVTIYNLEKKRKNKSVHGLVMDSFVGARERSMQVNHISGIKTDNRLENLEYVTASENLKHAYSIGLKDALGEKNGKSKLTELDVSDIRVMIKNKVSQSRIARFFGVDQSTVSNINTGKLWSHVI